MKKRRSVRDFSDKAVPREIIEDCIRAAATSPSGANRQPWYFYAISDANLKKKIRAAAEKVEAEFYKKKRDFLMPFGTNQHKPFLEKAPWLIAVFEKENDKYSAESVGLATGILITALHNAGLACLTYTPTPMDFLGKLLGRSEKPFMLVVTGYPAKNAKVPDISRKSLPEIASFQ